MNLDLKRLKFKFSVISKTGLLIQKLRLILL